MKKVLEFVKKYKLYILSGLLVIFFFRSCIKSGQVRKSDKVITSKDVTIDSLNNVINSQNDTIQGFPEVLRQEKIKIHTDYDNYISERDRGNQLMELHRVVKDNLKELEK
jgi:hypothetical protein